MTGTLPICTRVPKVVSEMLELRYTMGTCGVLLCMQVMGAWLNLTQNL